MPDRLLPLLSVGFGGNDDRQTQIELIPTAGGPVFDPLKATEVGAVQTLTPLLAPERLNRLEAQHAADASVPAPAQLFDLLLGRTLARPGDDVSRRIATTTILSLARVQRDALLSPTIALLLSGRLHRLADELQRSRGADGDWAQGPLRIAQRPRGSRQGACRSRAPPACSTGYADRERRCPVERSTMTCSLSPDIDPEGAG